MEENFTSSNGLSPDEKTHVKSKEITQQIINKLGPVNAVIKIIETDTSMGEISYLKRIKFEKKSRKINKTTIESRDFKSVHKVFTIKTFNATFKFTNEQSLSLNNNHGIDINELFIDTLIDEHVRGIMIQVLDKIKELANNNIFDIKDSLWEKMIKFFYKIIGKPYNRKFKVNNIRKIISKIFEASNRIAIKSKRGPATYLICSEGMAKLLTNDKMYKLSYAILENVGNIGGLEIIVDKTMKYNDMTIYVGRKTIKNEPGIYMPIMNTGTIITHHQDEKTKESIFSMKIRRCIINTEKCEDYIAKLDFKLTGKLKKNFLEIKKD